MFVRKNYMTEAITEPFLLRLQAAIDADPAVNPSNLATRAGLSNSAIRLMFRHNKQPRVSTMRRICTALGTTLEDFMGGSFEGGDLPVDQQTRRIRDLLSQLSPAELRLLTSYAEGLRDARDAGTPAPPPAEE